MKIQCSIKDCGITLESLLVPQERAIVELTALLARHVQEKHLPLYQIVQNDTMGVLTGLSFYLLISNFANVDAEEVFILNQLTSFEESMRKLITPVDKVSSEGGKEATTNNVKVFPSQRE